MIFANFAEAMAEGRGRAQAESLRKARKEIVATKLAEARRDARSEQVSSSLLRRNDLTLVEAGELIPADGEIVVGAASVDESAITGESAPVIRESGGDRSAVTGGTRVLSDWLIVRVTAEPGETFLDRMISMVEGAKRQKTPNEIALNILLAGADDHLPDRGDHPAAHVAVQRRRRWKRERRLDHHSRRLAGLSGADDYRRPAVRHRDRRHEPAEPGERGGHVGPGGRGGRRRGRAPARQDRHHHPRQPAGHRVHPGARRRDGELADAAQLASLADETPEGRSVVVLAKKLYGLRGRDLEALGATFVPFTAQTRMSGVDLEGRQVRKGAADAVEAYVAARGGSFPEEVRDAVDVVAKQGGTPLVVADGPKVLGVINLKDIVKGGIRERFHDLRKMGIKTVMITGDNPVTAASIAAEAGVDDFLAEATPEAKLALIRQYQGDGHLVAMTGDGTNDAPALAQADVAVAMNTGTQAAKEAGNMVDLDSNPTKLLEIVHIGKQTLMTRGSLTTFSIANDIAKYFAIIPAAFAATYPQLNALNIMHLATPQSAILSAVIFNAIVIVFLIPLALRGVKYKPRAASALLRNNLLVYGLGGLVVPFVGIKIIDLILHSLRLV